jgi:hypothetical protein
MGIPYRYGHRDRRGCTIVVDSIPAAASVRLDGKVAGVTPVSITVDHGQHAIEVRHGENARAFTVSVARGETTTSLVDFVAAPSPRPDESPEIRITSQPTAAQVSIDGVVRGATPLVVPDLKPGSHVVVIRSGREQASQSINVAAGRPQSLHVLLPESPAPPGPGWISVTVPMPLRVLESGRVIGVTGAGPIVLAAGTHELDFVNEQLNVRVHQQVTVRPGMTTTVSPSLPRGWLAINAAPGAEVWLNGERAGETPLGNLSLPVGRYEVLLRHPELGERRTRVQVTADTAARVDVDMAQQRSDAP